MCEHDYDTTGEVWIDAESGQEMFVQECSICGDRILEATGFFYEVEK